MLDRGDGGEQFLQFVGEVWVLSTVVSDRRKSAFAKFECEAIDRVGELSFELIVGRFVLRLSSIHQWGLVTIEGAEGA